MGLIAFSYSRLDGLGQCPRKYYETNVAKSVKEEENEQAAWGTEVHLRFAEYFKKGTPLPLHMAQYQKFLAQIKLAKGDFIVEQKLAINANYEPTGWYDKDVYCRVISDLTIINGNRALTFDWKTGKVKPGFKQLRLSSAVIMQIAPHIETVTHAYFWLKEKSMTRETVHRSQIPEIWSDFLPEIQRFQDAYANNFWPAKPNYLCRGYCPVQSCLHWEPRKKR
jgi:hypothetical protein